MTYFTRLGNIYKITDENAIEVTKALPTGNYIVKQDPMSGQFYLEKVESFSFSGKRYGDLDRNVDRIMNTFSKRSASTGVMLTGEKGSGKSLLAKVLSITAAEQGIPTLIVNSPWCGDVFNKFIQDIDHECLVMFDEFEKTYDAGEQQSLLTLLDGMFPTKKLFVLTCNDKYRVDQHMRNRPGRIFYMLDFSGLTPEFIREYCQDRLEDKSHIESICRISALLPKFTFDQLQALVEEMNRYGEGPEDALAMLNVKPEFNEAESFEVQIKRPDGSSVDVSDIHEDVWRGNPLEMRNRRFSYSDEQQKDEEGDSKYVSFHLGTSHITSVDPMDGIFSLTSDCGHIVTLTRPKHEKVSAYRFLA